MADGPSLGSAYLRVAGDFSGIQSQAVGLFRSSEWGKLGKVAGAALGAGLVAGGAVKALYEIGSAFDDASDKIRTQSGATGKELDKLERNFKKVVSSVPTDFDSASTAIAGLNQRLGLTGKPLTSLTKQLTQLSLITKTDVQENVESITRLFGDWSIKTSQQRDKLDELFRVTQSTGIGFSDLSRLMVQFGSPLRQLGLDFETSAAMFARFEREGVNIQTLMPGLRMALKNFSAPTADLSKTMKQLGIDIKDGPSEALQDVMEAIKDAPSDLKANGLAFEVFGARAGPDMAAAIREGRFELDDLIETMKQGDSTISGTERKTRDFSEQWTLFKNNLEVAVAPAAEKVFGAISDGMKEITKIFRDKDLDLGEKFEALVDLAMEKLGELVGKAAELAPKVAAAFVKGFLDAPALAQLAVGAWLLKKFGGLGALRSLGGKVFGGIFGGGAAGGTGSLTGPGMTPARPLFVSVVNQLPGGKPGAPGTPGGGPKGSPKPAPVPPRGGGGPGNLAPLIGTALAVTGTAYLEAKIIGPLGKFLDKHNAPAGSGSVASVVTQAGEDMLNLRQEVKRLAEEGKKVPAKMILKAGLDPAELKKAGVSVSGLRGAVKDLHSTLEKRVKAQFGDALGDDGRIVKDEVHDMLNTVEQLPPGMRKQASKAMVDVARELRDGGRISDRELQQIRDMVDKRFGEAANKATEGSDKLRKGVLGNVFNLVRGMGKGLESIVGNTNKALDAFGVKAIPFSIAGTKEFDALHRQHGGLVPTKSAVVPGPGSGDTVPLHMAGQLVAMVEPGELVSVANRSATAALMGVNRKVRRGPDRLREGGTVGGMAAMQAMASKFEAADERYLLGGGHGGFLTAPAPVDCSGFVSAVLHAGGLLQGAPMVSGALMNWGKPGKGPLTVYANPGHTFMSLDGRYYGTSRSNPGGGAGLIEGGYDSGYLSGFVARTMDVAGGIASEVARVILKGPNGPLKSMGQAALDKVRKAANSYLSKKMPTGQFGGGDGEFSGIGGSFDKVWPAVNPDLRDWQRLMGEIVQVESSGDPHAGGPGSSNPGHAGWYQYDSPTWMGDRPGGAPGWPEGPYDPAIASAGAGNAIRSDGMAGVRQRWTNWDGVTPRLAGGGIVPIGYTGVPSGVTPTKPPPSPGHGKGPGLNRLFTQLGAKQPKRRRKALGTILDRIRGIGLNTKTFERMTDLSNLWATMEEYASNAASLDGDMPWEIRFDRTAALPYSVFDPTTSTFDAATGETTDLLIGAFASEDLARARVAELQQAALGRFAGKTQAEWLGAFGNGELQKVWELRNVLVSAEAQVEKRQEEIGALLVKARDAFSKIAERVRDLDKKIKDNQRELEENRAKQDKAVAAIAEYKDKLEKEQDKKPKDQNKERIAQLEAAIKSEQGKLSDLKDDRDKLTGRKGDLAAERQRAMLERDNLKDKVIPEMTGKSGDLVQLATDILGGGGDAFDGLETLQGRMPKGMALKDWGGLPDTGILGGEIFDVQTTLAGLGFPNVSVSDATPTDASTTSDADAEELSLLKQLNAELTRELAIIRAQSPVFASFPKFHEGGVYRAPVPGGEGPATLRDREGVFTKEQMEAIGGPPVIHNHFYIDGEEIRGISRQEVDGRLRTIAHTATGRGPVVGMKAR